VRPVMIQFSLMTDLVMLVSVGGFLECGAVADYAAITSIFRTCGGRPCLDVGEAHSMCLCDLHPIVRLDSWPRSSGARRRRWQGWGPHKIP